MQSDPRDKFSPVDPDPSGVYEERTETCCDCGESFSYVPADHVDHDEDGPYIAHPENCSDCRNAAWAATRLWIRARRWESMQNWTQTAFAWS